jgi:hypothetical protein
MTFMARLHLACALTVLTVLSAMPTAGAMPVPKQGLNFTVLRDGDPVGSDVLTFESSPQGLKVSVKTNIVVKIAMIPVYRFEHEGYEVWQGDSLVTLRSTTNDDGTAHHLTVAAKDGRLEVHGDGYDGSASLGLIPGSLWNPALPHQATLLNSLDGKTMAIRTQDLGEDAVQVRGTSVKAHHYAIDGDLKRELWYGSDGALVQVRFKAKDNSDIMYVLR